MTPAVTKYIGWDVHKASIIVAVAEGARPAPRMHGEIANTPAAVAKLARSGAELPFCYEAGPCGYGVHRQLHSLGFEYLVVAPSLISRQPGQRHKTDRRDALTLAQCHRAGDLTRTWVPAPSRRLSAIWCAAAKTSRPRNARPAND